MSTNDYVKYVTQQIVSYMDKPKEVRKSTKIDRKSSRPPITNHLFGIIPLAIRLLVKRRKN